MFFSVGLGLVSSISSMDLEAVTKYVGGKNQSSNYVKSTSGYSEEVEQSQGQPQQPSYEPEEVHQEPQRILKRDFLPPPNGWQQASCEYQAPCYYNPEPYCVQESEYLCSQSDGSGYELFNAVRGMFGCDTCCDTCPCYDCAWGYDPAGTLNPDYRRHGIFMPSAPTLFPQFIADPRAVDLSAGWRFNDQIFAENMIDVSYGQWFPVWRWFDVFSCGDAMQFELEGALWAIFDPLHESSPLVNADYYIGFPLTYKCGRWSWKLRGYHISSHLGDEFLLEHPQFVRRNPSAQYVDMFVAYELLKDSRIYFGYGRIFQVDSTFQVKRNYFEWGAEVYLPFLNYCGWKYCVEGRPFFAMHMRNLEEDNYRQDGTYALGYEFHKLTGLEGKLRAFVEYHKGASLEGQFAIEHTDYWAIRFSYGY